MNEHDVLKKNRNFYIGVGGTVLEGLLSGSLFMLLYSVMQFLWSGQFDMNRVLALTGIIAVVFLLRILIYSYGYTKAQIGGAEVSKNIRLFMGDHLKRIPLSRFTQGQTGDYINTITSAVNNYEKILTHKVGDFAKNFALSLMLIVFVMTLYVPAGIILLIADLLLIPGLWLSFRMVRKYGKEKNDICAENVSSIVEYVSGIQTFRAYGVGGMKNKTVINAMREFSRISFMYESKVLPIGAVFGILSWLSCPLVILLAYAPWVAGTLNTVDYLLICMLPLFCAKLANSIFVDLTSYKNLMISKNKILSVMNEPEETGSMEPLHTATHEITFDNVDFAYVPGEPVIDHNPTIYLTTKGGGVPQEDRQALTDEQVERLLDAIRDLPPYVFVMIGLYAGLRREEILALQWDSVYLDTDTPYLTVRRAWHTEHNRPVISDELKTKAAERNIPLPICLADCLREAKVNSTSEYVVPNRDGEPLSYTQFKRLWQYIVTRTVKERSYYRYEDGKRVKHTVTPVLGEKAAHNGKVVYSLDFEVTPHQLRHTYITNLIHASVDPKTVQYLAGHESSKITMDIYAKVKYNRPDELVRSMSCAFASWDAAQ